MKRKRDKKRKRQITSRDKRERKRELENGSRRKN